MSREVHAGSATSGAMLARTSVPHAMAVTTAQAAIRCHEAVNPSDVEAQIVHADSA